MMKMILAILRDEDCESASQALITQDFRVTRIASTGGFLRRGSTTLLVGVEDHKVDEAIRVIKESCTAPTQQGLKRATLFVLNVANFEQI